MGLGAISGCSSGGRSPAPAAEVALPDDPTPTRGLSRDVNTAIIYAATRSEMAVVHRTSHDGGTARHYDLITLIDEPVWIRVSGLDPAHPTTLVDLTVEVRVGRTGDPARERQIRADIRARLARLADDPWGERRHPVDLIVN